ncbi:hypothetical protein LZ24_02895 [Desulfobotulus alkaliphilus]|uniref:Uncharacterized protein n=1 Tax=Desulfobotulus alkaliphilus TaxID=622671 RepID=A0A562RC96_9BACT|nr:hypothetical protein [Desulfobotulus alkaliphilus]TWI66672.1 hypothetical protein LZ24_02895 [Desulfobotulus alkaliphilus]
MDGSKELFAIEKLRRCWSGADGDAKKSGPESLMEKAFDEKAMPAAMFSDLEEELVRLFLSFPGHLESLQAELKRIAVLAGLSDQKGMVSGEDEEAVSWKEIRMELDRFEDLLEALMLDAGV